VSTATIEEPAISDINANGISSEKREQASSLIRLYCNRPFREHGKPRTAGPYKGWHLHDWGHVVQRVYRMYYDLPLDIPSATIAAKPVRSEFPNRNDWEKRVHSPRAQTQMLALIEEGLAPFKPATEKVEQPVA
jgi:hypothetical protein